MPSPEDQARENIDRRLTIRNFSLKTGHGFADYLLYVDGRAAGVVEAKKEGVTLTGVARSQKINILALFEETTDESA